ncbi:MAG: hypothetical protein IPL92_04780 [Saprospiraceae bacterium]|nr:hypothetical protein [Candidatus Opimibacter iunctus]
MSSTPLKRPAIAAALLFVLGILAWEFYQRKEGVNISYDDDGPLWAYHRARVYQPADQSTVFIGSSRIKFDLDIDTWESITGDNPVQLACVGSTPLPVLYDLADDPDFKGRLVIDVTEGLFFSTNPGNRARPDKALKYYKDITPAQCASFVLNRGLESTFVFLDREDISLNALMEHWEIPSRPGVFMAPIFPRDFDRVKFDRQEYMGPIFLADTAQINKQRSIWALFASMNKKPPISGAPLDSILQTVKVATDKIQSRGGQILFVRTPSSGPFKEKEAMGFPRDQYWEKILAVTGCPGLHYEDFPEISAYQCPEFSHLSPTDAIDFTKHFIRILQEKQGWKFPKMKSI